jgi:hypothetical protein
MKPLILISGITGTLLLMVRMLGIFIEFNGDDIVLFLGLALLGLVCLPLFLIDKRNHDRKIDSIIQSYEGRENKDKEPQKASQSARGWGMNDSPFRERKSGLTWGGGNIKAAEATRGTRRKFLKR